jgi:hypothetical protein
MTKITLYNWGQNAFCDGHLIFQCFCGYHSPLHLGLFSSLVITTSLTVAIQRYIVYPLPDRQFTQGQ